MPEEQLAKTIYPVGFWKKKAIYLKKTSQIILQKYDGDIPQSIEELVALPGVGMKMATLAMNMANKCVAGIGVDVHVHRIANRLGWVRTEKLTPTDTETALQKFLPRELWLEINELLVGFGQKICSATSPRCSECLNKDFCPASRAKGRTARADKEADVEDYKDCRAESYLSRVKIKKEEDEREEGTAGVGKNKKVCVKVEEEDQEEFQQGRTEEKRRSKGSVQRARVKQEQCDSRCDEDLLTTSRFFPAGRALESKIADTSAERVETLSKRVTRSMQHHS